MNMEENPKANPLFHCFLSTFLANDWQNYRPEKYVTPAGLKHASELIEESVEDEVWGVLQSFSMLPVTLRVGTVQAAVAPNNFSYFTWTISRHQMKGYQEGTVP